MLPYLLLLVLTAWMALAHMRPQLSLSAPRLGPAWPLTFVSLVLMIGFRFEVGGDWKAYLIQFDNLQGESLYTVLSLGDPAYVLLNWFGANVGGGIYLVNVVCAGLFAWGLLTFCSIQPRPWLALLVAVPFLVTVVAMGFTRQGVAIGLTMLAITKLQIGSISRYVFWIALAALFHLSAVILVPFAVFAVSRHRLLVFVSVVATVALLFVILLQEQWAYVMRGYIEPEYSASGAGIRIAMNAIPAALFLMFRNRFTVAPETRNFWLWMAWGSILLIPILILSPSSSAVDRVAFYWIPIQLMIFSRLPDAFGVRGRRNPLWVILVVFYSVAVMLTWLFFADHAYEWLPYRFYPWEALWQ
jgi:hypothetical protein